MKQNNAPYWTLGLSLTALKQLAELCRACVHIINSFGRVVGKKLAQKKTNFTKGKVEAVD